jgi:hypothetical protein
VTSRSLRTIAGALLYDAPRFETHLRGRWERICNRDEGITLDPDGRGVRCDWQWSSILHYCRVFPGAAGRLMRRAFADWPVVRAEAPPAAASPDLSFIIGHRGSVRVPLLVETVRSIAGQTGAAIECVVVEQSAAPGIRQVLPSWVRYVHDPIRSDDQPYGRAAAFNAGARVARGRVLILHDNDMVVPAAYASEALRQVDRGWDALDLKRFLFYLDEEGRHCEQVVQNARGGSIVVTRDAYEEIGGFDEGFVGWGGEDNDFWERAETLRASRFGYLPFIHLWHAPQPGKRDAQAPAVARYHQELAHIPPGERISRLKRDRESPVPRR